MRKMLVVSPWTGAAVAAAILLNAPPVAAQVPSSDRGLLWISEVSYAYRLAASRSDDRHYFMLELGAAWQYHPAAAIGAVVRKSINVSPEGPSRFPVALEARFRRALSGLVALDLGVGRNHGFVSHAGVSYDSMLQAFAHAEFDEEWRWIVGVGASGRPGVYAAIALGLLSVAGLVNQQEILRPGSGTH
jgi:hypothetical protein